MKKFYYLLLLFATFAFSQETTETNAIDITYLRGNILPHTDDLNHLITGHPTGFMVCLTRQTHNEKEWERVYGNPDYGLYFLHQDFKNPILGENYAIGTFYNFYFLHKKLMFKIAQGIAMTTNPQDRVTNSRNSAFGSTLMANTDFLLAYKKENIFDRFGLQAGVIFTHFSNGRIKAPNSGINTYSLNLGVNYCMDKNFKRTIDTTAVDLKFKEPIRYNFVIRSGINESPIIGSGQHSFFHVGFYADKRLNRKSALQLGTEVFFSNFYKDFIKYQSVAYPEQHLDPNTDYKRVGVFVGHELFINRISLEAQIGYYVYQPYKFDIPIYDRLGVKYYLTKKVFTGMSIKTHIFLAEALEFVVGMRI